MKSLELQLSSQILQGSSLLFTIFATQPDVIPSSGHLIFGKEVFDFVHYLMFGRASSMLGFKILRGSFEYGRGFCVNRSTHLKSFNTLSKVADHADDAVNFVA
jgi:hypothetical protein